MAHQSKHIKSLALPTLTTIVLAMVLAFCLGPLMGCSSDENEAASDNQSSVQSTSSNAGSNTDSKAEPTELKIDTDSYAITLPSAWAKYASVVYDTEGNAQVVYKNNASVVLLTCSVNEASDELDGGDIGNGMVYSTELSDDKRLDVWAPNYSYQFWYAATAKDATDEYAALSDDEKARIIKLTSGQKVSMKKLTHVKTESEYLKKYGTCHEYLGNLINEGITVK